MCVLEAVNFEVVLLCQSGLQQQLIDVVPLVPLELNHLPVLWVLHNSTIARKLLKQTSTLRTDPTHSVSIHNTPFYRL